MNKFPAELNVENKDKFRSFNYKRLEKKFRNDIYEFLLNRKDIKDKDGKYIGKDETEYFTLEFDKKYDKEETHKIFWKIKEELESLGWKTKLSYGDTGLFIYSTENPPKNCW